MSAFRLIAVVILLAGFFAGRGVWHETALTTREVPKVADEQPATVTPASSNTDELMPAVDVNQPRTDIYGNQVETAVGDYRVDPRGELYERHAPDTAVMRVGPAEL